MLTASPFSHNLEHFSCLLIEFEEIFDNQFSCIDLVPLLTRRFSSKTLASWNQDSPSTQCPRPPLLSVVANYTRCLPF